MAKKKDKEDEVRAEDVKKEKYIVNFEKSRKMMNFPIIRGSIPLENGKEITKGNYDKLPKEFREKNIKIV